MSCADILVLMKPLVCYHLATGMAVNAQADSRMHICTQSSELIHLNNVSVCTALSDLLCEKWSTLLCRPMAPDIYAHLSVSPL